MNPTRMHAIFRVLARGREEKLAQTVMRMFGAKSLDEAAATYDAIGKAERASIEEAVERVVAGASAAFQLGVENEERR